MLEIKIEHFFDYCKVSNFAARSIQSLRGRLNEFNRFINKMPVNSILWALGLRVSELTRLVIRSFEPGHGTKIGLLRVKGKNKKQRALFVMDTLRSYSHYLRLQELENAEKRP